MADQKKKKIVVLKDISSSLGRFRPGATMELDASVADAWIKDGSCAEPEKKKEGAGAAADKS